MARSSETTPPATSLLWYGALILTAVLWGIAFVPQRSAMQFVGPFTFNAIRFGGGSLLVFAVAWLRGVDPLTRADVTAITILGSLLFLGSAFQQIGMVSTTAGQGGFITGLYIVIVPILLTIVWKEWIHWSCWLGAVISVVGLGLVSLQEGFTIHRGDLWVLACAVAFSCHVIAVAKLSPKTSPLVLAAGQYLVCAVGNLIPAVVWEQSTWHTTPQATPQLLYMVFCSIGIAYTLQVVGQKYVPAANASIIFSLEAVFAALAGWYFLNEALNNQQFFGCTLMFVGILAAQIPQIFKSRTLD